MMAYLHITVQNRHIFVIFVIRKIILLVCAICYLTLFFVCQIIAVFLFLL